MKEQSRYFWEMVMLVILAIILFTFIIIISEQKNKLEQENEQLKSQIKDFYGSENIVYYCDGEIITIKRNENYLNGWVYIDVTKLRYLNENCEVLSEENEQLRARLVNCLKEYKIGSWSFWE